MLQLVVLLLLLLLMMMMIMMMMRMRRRMRMRMRMMRMTMPMMSPLVIPILPGHQRISQRISGSADQWMREPADQRISG